MRDFIENHSQGVCVVIIVLIVVAIIFGDAYIGNRNPRYVHAEVTDKTVKNYDDKGKYLIFTEDENGNVQVYAVEDSFVQFRFNSSDEYAKIKVGETYTFKVVGSRIPFLSEYPNIVDIQKAQ